MINHGGGWISTASSFGRQALHGRWLTVFGTVLIMAVSGPSYMFSAYSGVIKSSLGYTQTSLNVISFFKEVGSTFGLPSGLLMEVAPPSVVLAIGGVLNVFGYFMIWLAVTHRIAKPAVWQMCLYIALSTNSTAFSNTATLVPLVTNFPEARGVTLGILKGFAGLSSAILTQLYYAIFEQNPNALLLLLAFLPGSVCFAFIRTIRIVKTTGAISTSKDLDAFYKLLYTSLVLAGFLFSLIVLQTHTNFSRSAYIGSTSLVFLLLVLPPLYIVCKQEYNQSKQEPSMTTHITSETSYPPTRIVDRWWENIFRPPKSGEDHTILQALFRVDMIILLTGVIVGMGGTWAVIDNLGQIGTSLGYPASTITTFVSLVGIWTYLGRLVSGYVSEHIVRKYKLPRPLAITSLHLLSCVGHLLIAFGLPNGLYVASAVIGFCYGAYWPVLLAIILEIFGLKYYSTLSNIGPMASLLGIYLLNVKLTGSFYDREAMMQLAALGKRRAPGEELNCGGVRCFRPAFLIITVATAAAAFLSLINVARAREFYRGDIYRRFREERKADETPMGAEGEPAVLVVVEGRDWQGNSKFDTS